MMVMGCHVWDVRALDGREIVVGAIVGGTYASARVEIG